MRKYIVPTLESIEIKLSDCIALCDGTCPKDGNYMQWNPTKGIYEEVYLTVNTGSAGV